MAELAAEDGVSRMVTLTSIVLHQAISIVVGVVLAAVYFAVAGQGEWLARLRPILLLAPLALAMLQPRLLEKALNWGLARLRRPPVQVTLTWRDIGVLALRYALVWLGMGASFAALVRGVVPFGWEAAPYLIACWVAAYTVGFLSILTPSGLGVREAAMTLLLAPLMPSAVAAVVAIVARLWMVVAELIGAGVALGLARRAGKEDRNEAQAA